MGSLYILTHGPFQNELGYSNNGFLTIQLLYSADIGMFQATRNEQYFLFNSQLLHRFFLPFGYIYLIPMRYIQR